MLNIILDTNLFRKKCPQYLEDYELSALFEELALLISSGKIQDTKLYMNEMALLEYLKQIEEWYQKEIIDIYEKIFNTIKNSYPVQKLYFQSKEVFLIEYQQGIQENLQKKGVEVLKTIPKEQVGGVDLKDIVDKTVNNIVPFNKQQNENLKDAFISETINTYAKNNKEDTYVLFTQNNKDFEKIEHKENNYEIAFVGRNDCLLKIFNTIKQYGVSIDASIYYKKFVNQVKIVTDIKDFVENSINNNNYYNSVPIIKQYNEKNYFLDYEELDDKKIKVKFYLIVDDNEFECGIIYDASNISKLKMEGRYITIYDGEEEYIINEF